MEINRTITQSWVVVISEQSVLDRLIDEAIQEDSRRTAASAPSILASDDDKAILHRYYCGCLAELSALLARRTKYEGGGITNVTDVDTKMITTTYTMQMTDNHESALAEALGQHCNDFLVTRLMEKWYGHGSNFGSMQEKDEIRHILHFRRYPIERPFSSIL